MIYFMQTTRFYPKSFEDFGLKKIEGNLYLSVVDNSVWKERKLYDLGYGREIGFYRMPELTFDELIKLAFVKLDKEINEKTYNYWGSLSVLLDDHCEELIAYIKDNIGNDVSFIKEYKHVIDYINCQLNVPEYIIKRLSDKRLAKCCFIWKEIFNN